MATPKLKTGNAAAAPVRTLRPSGTVPTKQVKLKGATGKTIEPKKKTLPTAAPAAKAPKAPLTAAPAPEADDAAAIAAAEAQAAAEAEAARLAQEEYERQMEEYNRQMEEYNRQMAELQAAEAAAPAEEEAPAAEEEEQPEATEEEEIPESIAAAEAASDEAAEAAAAAQEMLEPLEEEEEEEAEPEEEEEEEMSEEERARHEAYVRALMEEEQRKPVWKTLPFMVGGGILVATIGVCTVMVVQKQAENARIQAHIDYTNTLLRRAQQINMQGVENQADAQKKKVDVSCSMDDAKALMEVVVDPFVKGENDKPRYGARAEGVAQNACLLLGLAAENNDAIRDMIFDTMGKNCTKITPTLFHWLLQRIAISDAKGVNTGLKKLSKVVANKKTAKPWTKKTQILSYIWECIGLRVTADDTKEILDLLKSDIADATLAPNLCNCLDNVLMMMEDADAKAALGDDIFTNMPDKLRSNPTMVATLARACSPKALEYYKAQLVSDGKGWAGVSPIFFGSWGSDEILDYVMEQKEANAGNAKALASINDVIGTILKQDRKRSVEDAEKLLNTCFKEPFADTSRIQDLVNKTDADSTLYVGDSSPDLEKLKEELATLEKLRKQKIQIIRMLGGLCDHEWVTSILKKYMADKDDAVLYEAEKALQKTQANTINNNRMREAYKNRSKD